MVPKGTPSGYSSMSTTAIEDEMAIIWEVEPLSKTDPRCPEPKRKGHVCEIGFTRFPSQF